jgi:hypothetical protein
MFPQFFYSFLTVPTTSPLHLMKRWSLPPPSPLRLNLIVLLSGTKSRVGYRGAVATHVLPILPTPSATFITLLHVLPILPSQSAIFITLYMSYQSSRPRLPSFHTFYTYYQSLNITRSQILDQIPDVSTSFAIRSSRYFHHHPTPKKPWRIPTSSPKTRLCSYHYKDRYAVTKQQYYLVLFRSIFSMPSSGWYKGLNCRVQRSGWAKGRSILLHEIYNFSLTHKHTRFKQLCYQLNVGSCKYFSK